jgi:hypothetical protein
MSLNQYKNASQLIEAMEGGSQYVRVSAGNKRDSVGRVVEVRSRYYSAHDYLLDFGKGNRKCWFKGSEVEYLEGYQGHPRLCKNDEQPVHNDLMGRPIEVGVTILFPRSGDAGMDMVMGTVRKISDKGAIYAKLFKSGDGDLPNKLVRVGKPNSAMIMANDTMNQVLMAKLAAF